MVLTAPLPSGHPQFPRGNRTDTHIINQNTHLPNYRRAGQSDGDPGTVCSCLERGWVGKSQFSREDDPEETKMGKDDSLREEGVWVAAWGNIWLFLGT